jgi:hypothetical protein
MTQPGYNPANEPMWWWKVAKHLDEAQLALANAMAHNVDDPRPAHALYERLREGQAILLEIFHMKGLLPGLTNGKAAPGTPMPDVPVPGTPMPEVPVPGVPGVPMPDMPTADEAAAAAPIVDQPIGAEESAVPETDLAAAAPGPTPPPEVDPATLKPEAPEAPSPSSADSGAGGAGG